MNACIGELKTRARIALKPLRAGDTALLQRAARVSGCKPFAPAEWQLRHALALVAQAVGFRHWDHARVVLAGEARRGDDMGRFWHAPGCTHLFNHWFARYDEAAALHATLPDAALLPYARQFVVVGPEYLVELGIADRLGPAGTHFDAVAQYGSPRWLAWSEARLRAGAAHWVREPLTGGSAPSAARSASAPPGSPRATSA